MASDQKTQKIHWYRSPVDRETLAILNHRNDAKGLVQTLGHLGFLAVTGTAAFYAAAQQSWLLLLLILFLHGTIYAFLLNGFHELCHSSVFETIALNRFFRDLFSFLGQYNPILFWASHQEHHKYTLHPPDDLEVVLPMKLTLESFLKTALVNPWGLVVRWKGVVLLSLGRLEGEWENLLFPSSEPAHRQQVFNWARTLLAGHMLILAVSLYFGFWLLPVLVTMAPYYGGWLLYLCNNSQHVGLADYEPDFRLCTRTITLNPVVQFLYWHMNFHTEHHMYAAVPCYNLSKLHQVIEKDLPPSLVGLHATWKQIITILQRQKIDPNYQYRPPLPASAIK